MLLKSQKLLSVTMILAYGLLGVLSVFAHHCTEHGCRDIQADTEHLHMAGPCMAHAGAKAAAQRDQKKNGSCCDRPHADQGKSCPLYFGNAGAQQLTRVIKLHWDSVDLENVQPDLQRIVLFFSMDREFHPDLVYEPLLTVRLII